MHVYPFFVALAALVGSAVVARLARARGIAFTRLLAPQAVLAAAGVIGAVVYNVVETGVPTELTPGALLGGGLRYPGGLLAVLISLPLVRALLPAGLSLAAYLDLAATGVPFAMALMRIGCLLQGCCFGVPSNLPWAVEFPPDSQVARLHATDGLVAPGAPSLPVHPLQLYFGLASLVVGVVLVRLQRRRRPEGQIFLLFVLLHEGAKGSLEFLRGAALSQSVMHLRVASLTLAALAATVLAYQTMAARRPRTGLFETPPTA